MTHPDSSSDLRHLGWCDFFEGARRQADRPDSVPGRVSADLGAALQVLTADGPVSARATPGVCVGDWVLLVPPRGKERAVITTPLARKTALVRQAAGEQTRRQAVAANLDVLFVVTAMDPDFNVRRLERYLVAAEGAGITPVVVLNKADLALGREGRYLRQVPEGVEAVAVSATLGLGIDDLREWLGEGRTGGLVGSSGVGKTSLLNALIGDDAGAVGGVRERDRRGQHTTTRRELHVLPDGVLIDTPGMRELALWEGGGLGTVFADVEALLGQCRFRDCGHDGEPGCAIDAAIDSGALDADRFRAWEKLQREIAWQERRKDRAARRAAGREFAKVVKAVKARKGGR